MKSDFATIFLGMFISVASQVNGHELFVAALFAFVGGVVAYVAKKLCEVVYKYIKKKFNVHIP